MRSRTSVLRDCPDPVRDRDRDGFVLSGSESGSGLIFPVLSHTIYFLQEQKRKCTFKILTKRFSQVLGIVRKKTIIFFDCCWFSLSLQLSSLPRNLGFSRSKMMLTVHFHSAVSAFVYFDLSTFEYRIVLIHSSSCGIVLFGIVPIPCEIGILNSYLLGSGSRTAIFRDRDRDRDRKSQSRRTLLSNNEWGRENRPLSILKFARDAHVLKFSCFLQKIRRLILYKMVRCAQFKIFIKNFFHVFWHGCVEHLELLKKECLFNFRKQIFQENFQKTWIFIFHYDRC